MIKILNLLQNLQFAFSPLLWPIWQHMQGLTEVITIKESDIESHFFILTPVFYKLLNMYVFIYLCHDYYCEHKQDNWRSNYLTCAQEFYMQVMVCE